MKTSNPIICAIDTQELDEAKTLCSSIRPHVGMVKLGLEFFTKYGPEGIRHIEAFNIPIFLDLKFHDIPNTVAKAVCSAMQLNVTLITVHTSGGETMMRAAKDAALEESSRLNKAAPLVIGVTVLTSLDNHDLAAIGYQHDTEKQVEQLASLAKKSTLDGIVCSPHEIALVKKSCGANFKTVVPGIRPLHSRTQDQKRTLTPKEALQNGADYLVIGRPITQSSTPQIAAKEIYESLT